MSSTSSRRSPTPSSSTTSARRRRPSIQQAAIITRQCELIHEALTKLRDFQGLETYWIEIHRLENEGDRIARAAVAALFDEKTKAIDMVKWKDIYSLLEAGVDKCEDVADIIEKICVKHA